MKLIKSLLKSVYTKCSENLPISKKTAMLNNESVINTRVKNYN